MTTPDEAGVQMFDVAFFLRLQKDLPANFGGIAKCLLWKILQKDRKVIHFVSDEWITPSKTVKDKVGTQQIYVIILSVQLKSDQQIGSLLFAVLVSKHHWWNSLFQLGQTVTCFNIRQKNYFH